MLGLILFPFSGHDLGYRQNVLPPPPLPPLLLLLLLPPQPTSIKKTTQKIGPLLNIIFLRQPITSPEQPFSTTFSGKRLSEPYISAIKSVPARGRLVFDGHCFGIDSFLTRHTLYHPCPT